MPDLPARFTLYVARTEAGWVVTSPHVVGLWAEDERLVEALIKVPDALEKLTKPAPRGSGAGE
jgi:hypothetical protein